MAKPIILTVDDELEVSTRSKDLRSITATYRVMKASSGEQALDTVRQLSSAE